MKDTFPGERFAENTFFSIVWYRIYFEIEIATNAWCTVLKVSHRSKVWTTGNTYIQIKYVVFIILNSTHYWKRKAVISSYCANKEITTIYLPIDYGALWSNKQSCDVYDNQQHTIGPVVMSAWHQQWIWYQTWFNRFISRHYHYT